ncbi:MAG: 23S rRNA (pseudouridine(1915)-N(3))-methyltransferase RlmH [Muribaculaceae bacterium]|nr:23S rRNA (pseudouridine(1915)-N(3))-methyltransferase RlmH [Muribaculaceae bacterium]
MKIKLLCMGTSRDANINSAIERYVKRIPFYWPFSIVCLPDIKTTKSMTTDKQKELEGEKFIAEFGSGDFIVLLDERGKEYTSSEFSAFIERKAVEVARNLVFVVGGPYGFSQAVYEAANAKISLSKMTFPHELVRLFFVEQIYRAGTISKGEPYHHD